MISLVKIYREMFENKQKQANDLTKQLEDLRAENDALRQKNADLNTQIAEHVKKCLYCKNLNFTQEIKFLDHKISELREENERLKSERDKFAYDLGVADTKNSELLRLLKECKEFFEEENQKDFTVISEMDELLTKIEEALK